MTCHPPTGQYCEIDTTPCQDNPCKHAGKCTEYAAGGFGCDCSSESWGGHLCELPKSCDFDPCVHGKCKGNKDNKEYVSCECDEGYTGATCEFVDCAACVNGICDDDICACYEGWYGPTCQDKNEEVLGSEEPLQIWIIVLIAVLSVLIVLSIVGVIMFKRKCMNNLKYNQVPKQPDTGQPPPARAGYYEHQPYQPAMPYMTLHQQQGQQQQHPHHGQCMTPDSQIYNHNMFQYPNYHSPHSGPLMQMQEMSLSTQTLDNEIKL